MYIYIVYVHTIIIVYIYIYIRYSNNYNIYKAAFSPGSVQEIMPYYSPVAHASTAV
jgi:hypothetical protein